VSCSRILTGRSRKCSVDITVMKTGGSTDITGLSLELETPVNKGLTLTGWEFYCGRPDFFVDRGIARWRRDVRTNPSFVDPTGRSGAGARSR
jgi:hypothetical protein